MENFIVIFDLLELLKVTELIKQCLANVIILKNSNDTVWWLEVRAKKIWADKMRKGQGRGGEGRNMRRRGERCDMEGARKREEKKYNNCQKKKFWGLPSLFFFNVLYRNIKKASIIFYFSDISPNTSFTCYLQNFLFFY